MKDMETALTWRPPGQRVSQIRVDLSGLTPWPSWSNALGKRLGSWPAADDHWLEEAASTGSAAGGAATFALGVGINTAVFASVDRLLFRPLPYRNADRAVLRRYTCTSALVTPVLPRP